MTNHLMLKKLLFQQFWYRHRLNRTVFQQPRVESSLALSPPASSSNSHPTILSESSTLPSTSASALNRQHLTSSSESNPPPSSSACPINRQPIACDSSLDDDNYSVEKMFSLARHHRFPKKKYVKTYCLIKKVYLKIIFKNLYLLMANKKFLRQYNIFSVWQCFRAATNWKYHFRVQNLFASV